jgi:hypothetical protein
MWLWTAESGSFSAIDVRHWIGTIAPQSHAPQSVYYSKIVADT